MKRLVSPLSRWLAPIALLSCLTFNVQATEYAVEKTDTGVKVTADGKLLTEYLTRSGAKPILFPLIGPGGVELTRGYPMRPVAEHERDDHIHHRSMWFTHGDVNGISFWDENNNHGVIKHQEFLETAGGQTAVIKTRNLWTSPDGDPVCEDIRRFEFGGTESLRWIDVDITVNATHGELTFGDTKEGAFGFRIAGSMKVDEKLGGYLVNSEGAKNQAAWGKPARWVDYVGPVNDRTVGITIMNHPDSYGYPSHWHVRTYGLFAANPFGLHDFYAGAEGKDGTLVLDQGESFHLKYRVLLHDGELPAAEIEKQFETYAN